MPVSAGRALRRRRQHRRGDEFPLRRAALIHERWRGTTFASLATLLFAPLASAHHSWSANYDLTQTARINGVVSAVRYESPHSSLLVDVKTADGRTERWTIEWASASRLRERGVTEHTVRSGDYLMIDGNPHRDPAAKALRLERLLRGSDGYAYP